MFERRSVAGVARALGVALSLGPMSGCGGSAPCPVSPARNVRASRPAAQPEAPKPLHDLPAWSYVLPQDYGIRNDGAGNGTFRARRSHGEHNGLDLLAPVGTPAFAACDGQARSGNTGAFGNWVQLVCALPDSYGGPEAGYFSVFYAHLSGVVAGEAWAPFTRGTALGWVGKTGNASGERVEPHLHLEVIVADDRAAAEHESHSGLLQTGTRAAASFLARLQRYCLAPNGFAPSVGALQRARRLDPFLVMSCLGAAKPSLATPPAPLGAKRLAWSDRYAAGFDPNQAGPRLAQPERPFRPGPHFMEGAWSGSFSGSAALADIGVRPGGEFVMNWQSAGQSCDARGRVVCRDARCDFELGEGTCAESQPRLGTQLLLETEPDWFASIAPPDLDVLERRADGAWVGPVWVFRREPREAGAPLSAGL